MTNLLWAFATLKQRHSRLFERLASTAVGRMHEFTPQASREIGRVATQWLAVGCVYVVGSCITRA